MRSVALLRAVNVGGRVVKMERLRQAFVEAGYTTAETFIASGNVVFDVPPRQRASIEAKIERLLHAALGFEVATFVRSIDDMQAVAGFSPFKEGEGAGLYVGFLRSAPPPALSRRVREYSAGLDEFAVHGREVYWRRAERGMGQVNQAAKLEKMLEMPATFRNITTVRRLAERFALKP